MATQQILAYGKEKGFHKKTLDRWLSLPEIDQQALLGLAQGLRMGENHFRDFLDWTEEIALRDGIRLCDILKMGLIVRISSDPRLGRNDKLKQIKEEVRRLRFPRLAAVEEEIRKKIREMKLDPQIQIVAPPGLEGGTLTVELKASSYEGLRQLVAELEQALEKNAMREIFAVLGGEGLKGSRV